VVTVVVGKGSGCCGAGSDIGVTRLEGDGHGHKSKGQERYWALSFDGAQLVPSSYDHERRMAVVLRHGPDR
jgi:hypothetical protein